MEKSPMSFFHRALEALKRTTLNHKKKIVFMGVIVLLGIIAKKKLSIMHIFFIIQKLTAVLNYLPIPQYPEYREKNNYQSINLNPLSEILDTMNIDEIRRGIREKTTDWNELKHTIFAGTILSMSLYNIQTFYFNVQNKYEADFKQLGSLETFERKMGEIRKKFIEEIPALKEAVEVVSYDRVSKVSVRDNLTFSEYSQIFSDLLKLIFTKHLTLRKRECERLENHVYKNQEHFKVAMNYFTTPLEYIEPSKKSSSFFSKIQSVLSAVNESVRIFPQVSNEITEERYEWVKVAYEMSFKKSLRSAEWPNKESQSLWKLVTAQIQQLINSVNFSTLIVKNAEANCKILENRLCLYFQKQNIDRLLVAHALPVIYKMVKQQLLPPKNSDKRQKFYEAEILRSIKLTKKIKFARQKKALREMEVVEESSEVMEELKGEAESTSSQQLKVEDQEALNVCNRHLEEIYQLNHLSYMVKEFELTYFNEREKIEMTPASASQLAGGEASKAKQEGDQMQKLLSLLGENQHLNKQDK